MRPIPVGTRASADPAGRDPGGPGRRAAASGLQGLRRRRVIL